MFISLLRRRSCVRWATSTNSSHSGSKWLKPAKKNLQWFHEFFKSSFSKFTSGHFKCFSFTMCENVAAIRITRQFHEFLNLIFGGFSHLKPLCVGPLKCCQKIPTNLYTKTCFKCKMIFNSISFESHHFNNGKFNLIKLGIKSELKVRRTGIVLQVHRFSVFSSWLVWVNWFWMW